MTTISIDEYIKILDLPAKFKTMQQDEQLKALNSAWRAYSRKYHPDICKSANAEAKFKAGNEAHEKLLELVKNGSIKYRKTESKQEYKQGYSSSNVESDPLDEAFREIFKEFEEKERLQRQKEHEEFMNVLIGVLVVVSAVLIGMVCVLGWELTVLIIANALCGAVGLLFKKSQSA